MESVKEESWLVPFFRENCMRFVKNMKGGKSMELIIGLAILSFLFWLGWKFTGALLGIVIWLLIRLPIGLILLVLGIALCCTIIGIPLGKIVCGWGSDILIPG